MKDLKVASILLAVICMISGCGREIDTSRLEPVSGGRVLDLEQRYAYTAQFGGICKPRIEYALASGRYQAEFRDEDGVFYAGPQTPVSSSLLASECGGVVGTGLQIRGGIYLPDNPGEHAVVYFYQPPNGLYDVFVLTLAAGENPRAGIMVDAIIRSGFGKINFLPLQPEDGGLRNRVTGR